MKLKLLLATLAFAWVTPIVAQATPVHYEGTIPAYVPVTGSVGGFGWIDDVAASVDFWSFQANAGSRITIRGTRLDSGLDTTFSLFLGTTSADASLFLHDFDWGGLTWLATADDQVSVPIGPFGDPLLTSFLIPTSGLYTIAIGGFASDGPGPYRYSLALAVPEPGSVPLLAAALICLVWARRRTTRPGVSFPGCSTGGRRENSRRVWTRRCPWDRTRGFRR